MLASPVSSPWVSCPRPNPQAQLRLFCFPYAGGGISAFHAWSDGWPLEVEICTIQLPGRETRLNEIPFEDLPSLVQALTPEITSFSDRPFAFYGHSLGALIAFELTRSLQYRHLLGPIHLFVSALRSPSLPNPNPPLHPLRDDDFLDEIEHRYGGIPTPVRQHRELMQLLLPALRADVMLMEKYLYMNGPKVGCPISAFGGLDDTTVGHDELATWRDQTCNSFTLRMLPGDHFFLRSARHLLIEAISRDLEFSLGSQSVWVFNA